MRIKNIKLIAFAILFLFMSNTFADGGGMLMGIQVAKSNLNNPAMIVATGSNGNDADFGKIPNDAPACDGLNFPNCQYFVKTKPSNTGFAFRIYGGAGFNKYAAVEAGLMYLTPSEYNPNVSYQTHEPQIREYAFDVLARLTLPVQDFGVFAKGGLAVVYKSQSGALDTNGEGTSGGNVYARPEIGFGVSYSFSYITIDVSSSRILGNSDIEEIDFTAIGLTYQFHDKYCGQFLC